MMEAKILYNSIITSDNTILVSRYRHDMRTHETLLHGEVGVDGGHDYLRRIGNPQGYTENSQYWSSNHAHNRKYYEWRSNGKCGTLPSEYSFLKDMSTEHVQAVLKYFSYASNFLISKEIFTKELEYRNSFL